MEYQIKPCTVKNLSNQTVKLPGVRWNLQADSTIDLTDYQTGEMLRSRSNRNEVDRLIRSGKIQVTIQVDASGTVPDVKLVTTEVTAPTIVDEIPDKIDETPAAVTEPTVSETLVTDEPVVLQTEQPAPESEVTPVAEDIRVEVSPVDSSESDRKAKGRKGKHTVD